VTAPHTEDPGVVQNWLDDGSTLRHENACHGGEPAQARGTNNKQPGNSTIAAADRGAILKTLGRLCGPDAIIELRAIYSKGRKRTDAGYFDFGHRAALADAAVRLNKKGAAIYFTLNAIDPQLLGRYCNRIEEYAGATATDANVIRRLWLLLDFDPIRPKDTSATDDQLEDAKALAGVVYLALKAEGWPDPIQATSGNGVHLLYPIDLPNDDASRDLVKAVLAGLAARFDTATVKLDKAVYNAARITKLYGTVATKGDSTPAAPHRLSKIVVAPARGAVVTVDQLRAAAPVPTVNPKRQTRDPGTRRTRFDLDDFLGRLGIDYEHDTHEGRDRYRLARCPFNEEHGKGDAAIFRSADGVLGFKCFHDGCVGNDWQALRTLVDGLRPGPRGHSGDDFQGGPGMGGDPGPWGAAEAPGDFPDDDGIRPLHGKRDTLEPVASLIKVPMDSMMVPRPPPRFAVDGYFPLGLVTLLGAHGGAGKSILALIWAALVACGAAFAGHGAICGRALFVSLEDGADMVLDRLRKIVVAYGLDQDAVMANVSILDGSTGNCALVLEQAYGKRLTATPLMAEIRAAADVCALVIIDNASDAFVGNENDRGQVRTFMRMLGELARSSDAAVLLLAHIDKNAAKYGAQGNSYSGSTAWHNSARSRLALTEQNGVIELVQEKLTVARKCAPVTLAWNDAGVLVPAVGGTGTGTLLTDAADVLAAIRAAEPAGINVPTGRTGPATTLHVLSTLAELPNTLRGPQGRDRFWRALGHLLTTGTIRKEPYRTPSRKQAERFCASSPVAPPAEDPFGAPDQGESAPDNVCAPFPPYPPIEPAQGRAGPIGFGTGANWSEPAQPAQPEGSHSDVEAF